MSDGMYVMFQSDVDFDVFMATRQRSRKRKPAAFIPPDEQRRRDYDAETEQLRRFIHGQQQIEKRTA